MDIFIILASSPPNPETMMDFLEVVTYLAVLAGGLRVVFARKPGLAELATKKELEGYVRQSQFNEFRMEVRGDVAEIKAMITGSVSKVEDYAEKSYLARKDIHKQVNGIDKQLTRVETRQHEQGKQITEINRHG